MAIEKCCFKCKTQKPLSEFYKHSAMADGHLNKCKECNKKDATETRLKRIDYYREYDMRRSLLPKRLANQTKLSKKYRDTVDGFTFAHNAVTRAIRNGSIVRPTKCERCSKETRLHAHHDDYSKPLDIMFLCPACHRQRHKEIGEITDKSKFKQKEVQNGQTIGA